MSSQEAHSICDVALTNKDAFQETMHGKKGTKKSLGVYYFENTPTSWNTKGEALLKRVEEDGFFVFTANSSFHTLNSTTMTMNIPCIILDPYYVNTMSMQIRWVPNLGINAIREAFLFYGDKSGGYINNYWFDTFFQFLMPSEKRESFTYMIGNRPEYTTWDTKMAPGTIQIPQIWDYCRSQSEAIRLCKFTKKELNHKYKMVKRVFNLLQVRVKDKNGEWKLIEPESKFFLNIKSDDELFDPPQLWGTYSLSNERELKYHQKDSPDIKFYRDILYLRSENPVDYGKTITVPLKGWDPTLAMFWKLQRNNEKEDEFGIHNKLYMSNYSTDKFNSKAGYNPSSVVSITHGQGTSHEYKNTPSSHFNRSKAHFEFPSSPLEPFYHGHSYTNDLSQPGVDMGRNLQKAGTALTVKLNNTDPNIILRQQEEKYITTTTNVKKAVTEEEQMDELEAILNKNQKSEVKDDGFILHILLLIVRKKVYLMNSVTNCYDDIVIEKGREEKMIL